MGGGGGREGSGGGPHGGERPAGSRGHGSIGISERAGRRLAAGPMTAVGRLNLTVWRRRGGKWGEGCSFSKQLQNIQTLLDKFGFSGAFFKGFKQNNARCTFFAA